MSPYILILLAVGLLLLTVTLGSGWIARLPFSYAIIYLIVGILLGSQVTGLINLDISTKALERITEMVVIISVFGCGLKMNRRLNLSAWNTTARLIGFVMPISIVALSAVARWILGMSWGAAILLGAILAPTDPVLASEVQLAHIKDKNELRFGLTSEGGLNDALAFPFVYFGIYALKDNNWNNWFQQWVLVDVIWAIIAGIVMGIVVAKAVIWIDRKLQRQRKADELMEDFVALSAVFLTYSLTELVNGYGFLAVFVAGWLMQNNYYHAKENEKRLNQLEFIEQIEKLLEVGTIVLLGTLLTINPIFDYFGQALLIAAFLLFIIRPLGVAISLFGSNVSPINRTFIGWFGIRGVGSLYYLNYAVGKEIGSSIAQQITWITIITVVFSIVVHGISSTPLMMWYKRRGST
ncbi:sodium/hydrogen exchanger [Calothrix parasitica NIES-267]|uniref:Sodium/hydrogen exchanger n=1 Tax=Calothrix parasitica NIES-267 TaxID=1973488 RepID=A0A1Z4LVI5_9CYAN|nr:sodium/hydrogen exchanger [Calothrix parasitica NIES-267]